MSQNLTLHVSCHRFTNHNGPQAEYNVSIDGFTIHYHNTVDDFVKNLRRKMNIYIAVDIKREETRVKTVEKA